MFNLVMKYTIYTYLVICKFDIRKLENKGSALNSDL